MIIYAIAAASVFLSACAGRPGDALKNNDDTAEMTQENTPESPLGRPRFDKPSRRPLSHVLIRWNRIQGADGYELESSETRDFSAVKSAWTTSSTSIELPLSGGSVLWFQVRSFDENSVSRWSSPLRVKEGEL